MEYAIKFGTLNANVAPAKPSKSFRIALLGDFSGKGNAGRVDIGDGLAKRKPLRANHDNVNALLERLDVNLNLPAGASGAMISVPIRSLDDFHPDQLYNHVPLFEKLVSLRQKLRDPASFPKAAAAVRSLAGDPSLGATPVRKSSSSMVPRGRIESFADLIQSEVRVQEPAELKTLLRDVVSAHVVAEMQGQAELIAAVDASLSDLMRRLLHHPDFQAMESLWRSLDFILHRLELDSDLDLVLYDLNAAELAADLASTDSLEETGLYKWLVESPSLDGSQGALSLLICNFVFELIPPHAELLARVSKIAAAAGAPFIAAVDCNCLKKQDPEQVHPLVAQSWQALRQLPEAAYLGLTAPRFMLRWPYGKKTEPIESFAFEEFTPQSGLNGMLWGNSAFLAGLTIGQTFLNDGLSGMKLGSVLTVDDIPFYFYTDSDGDQIALPCTERLVNVRTAQYATIQGFIPVLSIQGRSEVRLGGLQAFTGSPLAGPWAPSALRSTDSANQLHALQPSSSQPAVALAENPVAESAQANDELADLLSDLDSSPPATAASAEPDAGQDDLDNLLASLDSEDATKSASQAEADIDNDLAALLNDL